MDELIPQYLDGDLGPEETALVKGHIASCERCASSLELYAILERSLATRSAEVPSWQRAVPPMQRTIVPWRRSIFVETFLSAPVLGGAALAACGGAILLRGGRILLWLQETASRLAAGVARASGGIASHIPQFTPSETLYLFALYAGVAVAILVTGRVVLVRCMRR